MIADGVIVWQGTLVPLVLKFEGPVGLRSDNAHVVLDFLVGGLELVGSSTVCPHPAVLLECA